MKIIFSKLKEFFLFHKSTIQEYLILINSLSFFYILLQKGVSASQAEGESMVPTLEDKSVLIIDKFFYKYNGIKNNDIIVAKSPVKIEYLICKRVKHS